MPCGVFSARFSRDALCERLFAESKFERRESSDLQMLPSENDQLS